jgi:hypothetical protein
MADIDPYAQLAATQLTPRSPNLVDAIAEASRITDAQLRANPLYNAKIDGGLMVWRGNYAGDNPNDPIRDSFLWIGEFGPRDAVKGKLQRGIQITRDDPKHTQAFAVFDPQAAQRTVSDPLRQRVFMQDADGKQIISEAIDGGVAFPWVNVPLYPANPIFTFLTTATGGNTQNAPILQSWMGLDTNVQRTIWEGYAPCVSTRLEYLGYATAQSATTLGLQLRITFDDPDKTQVLSSEITINPSSVNAVVLWNLDFKTLIPTVNVIGRQIRVEVLGRLISGQLKWGWHYPTKCRIWGP